MSTATLLLHCQDKKGIVLAVTEFIYKNGGNVTRLDQHIDAPTNTFFMRISWNLKDFSIPQDRIEEYFRTLVAEKYAIVFDYYVSEKRPKMAVFVTKVPHCLYDILARWQSGAWNVDIPVIVSNHDVLKPIADQFGIPFHQIKITKENKAEKEQEQLELLQQYGIDFIVLARYMQILSDSFINSYQNKIINIHHSFLPAFPGAKPYHSAHERGVKIIGATSHYVTADLDAGPIIEQDVVRVNHKNTIDDLIRKGQDLEKLVLSRAIYHHLNRNLLVFDNRTIVFE